MRVVLRGGPRDGLTIDVPDDNQHTVRIPFVDSSSRHARVLTMEEFDDPDNWEVDPTDGRLRLKRPPIGIVEYHRTDEREGDCVVFA